MNLKSEITKIHYNKNTGGFLFGFLKLASFFYGIGSGVKNILYDRGVLKPKKVAAFVISVGNFTTGGVGKTPVVAEIARHFIEPPHPQPLSRKGRGEERSNQSSFTPDRKEREEESSNQSSFTPDYKERETEQRGIGTKPTVAIVSRGYGGKLDNKKVNVISDGINLYYKADMAGDEPYWLAVNLNMCAVLTCANRVKAAEYAIKELGVTTIILDDGFQHRKMARDLDIVLVDSEKMFGNENLLPAGPLREKPNFERVNKLVVVSKNVNHMRAEKFAKIMNKKQNVQTLVARVEPDYVYNIISGEHLEKGGEITALSAIGQPEQFYQFLENDYKIKEKITFDDHHQYVLEDIENIQGNIVTTEKDAVKLALLNRANIYALKLKTVVDVESLLA